MTRTMTMTVIRGEGEGVDVIVNNVVKQELRNRLLAEQLAATRRALYRRPPLGKRIRNRIADIWAVFIGTIIVWGEALGLWEYEED